MNFKDKRPFILISDIDDTLKRTHRLSKTGMLKKGMRSRNSFAGMSELYAHFSVYSMLDPQKKTLSMANQSINGNPARIVAYVTGAISKFQWFSCLFLIRSNFPVGLYRGRDRGRSFDFKVSAIQKLLEDFPDYTPVFVGDNGEDDPLVFDFFQKKLQQQNKRALFYVHKVYDKPIPQNQTAFLSATDLAVHFFNENLIDEDGLEAVCIAVSEGFHENPRKVLPRWVVCPDIGKFWPQPNKELKRELSRRIEAHRRLMIQKMARAPRNPRAAAFFEFS